MTLKRFILLSLLLVMQSGCMHAQKVDYNTQIKNPPTASVQTVTAPWTFSKGLSGGIHTVTFSATPAFDFSTGDTQKITLVGNVTSSTATNLISGQRAALIVCQDATGGRAFTFPTSFVNAPAISGTANTCTGLAFDWDGTSAYSMTGAITGGGTGTVTSVALDLPASVFTVSGSPVTSSGTLSGSFNTQSANMVLAGPTTGSAAVPAFRALVAADIPNLPESQITNLPSDLAALAPIASPTFTGTPNAPTPVSSDNSTKIATTAFVQGVIASLGPGSVTSFSAGNLSPLFSSSVATATTTPALSFTLSSAGPHSFFGNNTGSTGTPAYVAITAGDLPNLPESQITNLTTDLAAKAPLSSPTFTGTPAAPTPTAGDNTTKLATTAFVQAAVSAAGGGSVTSFSTGSLTPIFSASVANATTTPALSFSLSNAAAHSFLGNNTGSTGAPAYVSLTAADIPNIAESQVTSLVSDLALKAPLASPALTGTPTAPTPLSTDNSTTIATTAFVQGLVSAAGGGSVTNFSASSLSPLFTASVSNPTTTPSLTFTASSAAAHSYYGNNTGTSGTPGFVTLSSGDIPNNAANTSGTAANLSGTPTLPNGTAATTQVGSDNSTKLATTAFVQGLVSSLGGGSVTNFTAGSLSPLFTTSVANPTSTPALTFSLATAASHTFLGNNTGSTAAPTYVQPAFTDLSGTASTAQIPALPESKITNLTTDLAAKAPIASPTFTGTVTLPITGVTQCVNASSSGVLSGAGFPCGSVTTFSVASLSPIFTASISNPTSTPALTFSLSTAGAHAFLGNNTGSTAAPTYVQPAFTDISGTATPSQLPLFTSTANGIVPSSGGGTSAFLRADGIWSVPPSASGTVSSVGISMPAEFSVSGSPVTSSGTLSVTKAVQSANAVYAGPSSGASAAPAFRALVAGDIPTIAESQVTNLTTDLAAKVPATRAISTTLPLTGGGDLSANRTLAINNFGGDSGSGGTAGAVPAPAAGDAAAGKFLKANGTWAVPPSSGGGSGTVTSISIGNLTPVFTASIANATTTPAISFSLSSAAAHSYLGNNAGTSGVPTYVQPSFADLAGRAAMSQLGTGTPAAGQFLDGSGAWGTTVTGSWTFNAAQTFNALISGITAIFSTSVTSPLVQASGVNGGLKLPSSTGANLTLGSTDCGVYTNSVTGYPHYKCAGGTVAFDVTSGGTTLTPRLVGPSGGSSPSASQTYYLGTVGAAIKTTPGTQNGYIVPVGCTLKSVTYYVNIGTLDSTARSFTFSIDKNAGTQLTDTINATISTNVQMGQVLVTTGDALIAGDVLRLRIDTPGFGSDATPPSGIQWGADLLCQ